LYGADAFCDAFNQLRLRWAQLCWGR
jgi:hypothetical protein